MIKSIEVKSYCCTPHHTLRSAKPFLVRKWSIISIEIVGFKSRGEKIFERDTGKVTPTNIHIHATYTLQETIM